MLQVSNDAQTRLREDRNAMRMATEAHGGEVRALAERLAAEVAAREAAEAAHEAAISGLSSELAALQAALRCVQTLPGCCMIN